MKRKATPPKKKVEAKKSSPRLRAKEENRKAKKQREAKLVDYDIDEDSDFYDETYDDDEEENYEEEDTPSESKERKPIQQPIVLPKEQICNQIKKESHAGVKFPRSRAWIAVVAVSLVIAFFTFRANGGDGCTFKDGGSYWDAVSAIQNAQSLGAPQMLADRMRKVEKAHSAAIKALKDSLSRKKDEFPLVLLLAGPPEAREEMFTASEWLASSLLRNASTSPGVRTTRPSYMVGNVTHALLGLNASDRRRSFHSTLSEGLTDCGKTVLALDASLVAEFLDLLSTVVEDGANPHLQRYIEKGRKGKDKEVLEPRELSTRESIILFIASLSSQDLASLNAEVDPNYGPSLGELILRKVKENFKWEDRFGQRIAQVIPFT